MNFDVSLIMLYGNYKPFPNLIHNYLIKDLKWLSNSGIQFQACVDNSYCARVVGARRQ